MCLLCGTVRWGVFTVRYSEMGRVYCAVQTLSLNVVHVNLSP